MQASFVLGAAGGMLSDRFGPRAVCSAGMVCIAGGLVGAIVQAPDGHVWVGADTGIYQYRHFGILNDDL